MQYDYKVIDITTTDRYIKRSSLTDIKGKDKDLGEDYKHCKGL
jgi:hypothetical protein